LPDLRDNFGSSGAWLRSVLSVVEPTLLLDRFLLYTFPLVHDGLTATNVHVLRRQLVEALVIALSVVTIDKLTDVCLQSMERSRGLTLDSRILLIQQN
jgi:hypothetical protein